MKKLCPFCRSDDVCNDSWVVVCGECGATGPDFMPEDVPHGVERQDMAEARWECRSKADWKRLMRIEENTRAHDKRAVRRKRNEMD